MQKHGMGRENRTILPKQLKCQLPIMSINKESKASKWVLNVNVHL